jgi:hypothetical protein
MSSEVKANKISPATGTAFTFGDSGDTFTVPSGATITNSGTATGFGGGLFSSYAIIADQKSSGTQGGTATLGAWRTRDLQTEIADPDGIVSITTNEFTLGAGTYLIKWTAPAHTIVFNQTRLYNSTDATEVEVGQSAMMNVSGVGISGGSARTTIAGSKAFRIEHQCSTTLSSEGFGRACSFGTEQYTLVEIYKEA